MNFNVLGYELDAYWEPERFAVELDVYETHGSHAAFERDRLRQEDLKLKGVEMIRVTGPRLRSRTGGDRQARQRPTSSSAAASFGRCRTAIPLTAGSLELGLSRGPQDREWRRGSRRCGGDRAVRGGGRRGPGEAPPPVNPWQRAALIEGVGAKETVLDSEGGAKWQS